ncbi:MAG: hypothetical protein Q9211_003890 [Gyalolechia sp. 1 TL-2023]
MVNLSDGQNSLFQSRPSTRVANAPRSHRGAGNYSPHALNDISSQNGRNVTVSGGQRVSSISLPVDTITSYSPSNHEMAEKHTAASPPPAPPPDKDVHGEKPTPIEAAERANVFTRFYGVCKGILLASWINTLLVFVPVGIAVEIAGISPTIIFAMNAVAIVPLAGLLSYATESVACEMGDTIGALMNVTFGNAVELIIFMYNEIRIVQASLLGSILANLLLILGMCFLYGGLRFREQIYNNTVTQMSACLLSLSVMSLLLPTAFHASFTDNGTADEAVLHVSRGTSVILLLVYVLYLLFQLKSHAYLYQSTPQHLIDEESHPGFLAEMLHSSDSSSSSNSSSDSDSDGSSRSHTTAKRIRRALKGRRRRRSSASSKDTPSAPSMLRTPSASTSNHGPGTSESTILGNQATTRESVPHDLGTIACGDEAEPGGGSWDPSVKLPDRTIKSRDFEMENRTTLPKATSSSPERRGRKSGQSGQRWATFSEKEVDGAQCSDAPDNNKDETANAIAQDNPRANTTFEESLRLPFGKRGLSNVLPAMSTVPRVLSTTVFSAANPTSLPTVRPTVTTAATKPLHRSTSLPSRLNRLDGAGSSTAELQPVPYVRHVTAMHPTFDGTGSGSPRKHLSRTSAVLLLIVSTGLVAVCAEFLVSSINYLVDHTGVSEAFIGLIVLPIVGNAAEHVAAVTVAGKNKMDLAIGIAVGSSIQIALFVTPVIVLLGWALQKDMSLYFSLFETVSLFVSAFIINFLILDGKTNYLEGALLIAAYVIIALAAFFYPDSSQQSSIGGAEDTARKLLRLL